MSGIAGAFGQATGDAAACPREGLPTRFLQDPTRGRRLGRPLIAFAGVSRQLDAKLLRRVGEALNEQDESGTRLAQAMALPSGHHDRVTRRQLGQALDAAPLVSADVPPALASFMAEVTTVPDWVEWPRVDRGAAVFQRLGRNAMDVLLQLSLIGGYRFGGPADLLVRTGGLNGDSALGRLAETQRWNLDVTTPGELRPGRAGWRATVHVRAMHALINEKFAHGWDVEQFGLPINQSDQAGTLGLFDATVILGCRVLGVPLNRQDRDDLMHLWKYVGWLLGVAPEFLTDDEGERSRINYHVLVAAGTQTQAGRELAQVLVEAQAKRTFGHRFGVVERAHQRFVRARTLSMLTAFLGVRSMRELGLPVRVPWAFGAAVVENTVRYRVLGKLPDARRRQQLRGGAVQERIMRSTNDGLMPDVGGLPVVTAGECG